jgi:hypothetical protein
MKENKEVLDLEPDTGKKEEKPKKKCNRSGCQFEAHEQEELDTHDLTCLYRHVKCYKCNKSGVVLANINDGKHAYYTQDTRYQRPYPLANFLGLFGP